MSEQRCGWQCWPEFDLNPGASRAENACSPPPSPEELRGGIFVSGQDRGRVRLVVARPLSPPQAGIIAWRARVEVIGPAPGAAPAVGHPEGQITRHTPGAVFELPAHEALEMLLSA